ncbi:alpha-(1-_3)-arabinofuranosyltransferase family protein [Actinocorallia sp. B10E7]|uniref:alpha-(1->3)-arabinofuranosyltransferase domain-containing protein n=1 Tax=Actinocorallia sp. B10E7 TaxID=3153558 RepID=UPI00325DF391
MPSEPSASCSPGSARPPQDRVRLAVSLLVLQTLAFAVRPGRVLPDTKLDMALNPSGFLARAAHMWDPSGSLGQVQNQAYGYFFPMGPFYLLGDLLHLPPWIVQRLWLGVVLCTAFLGVVRLAEALRLGSGSTRLLAGFAYALAPRAQVLLGTNSSEFWPTAMLPWILLPLVTVRSPRRAAALSALAVAACGGINATAVLAVLVVPLLYLLWHRRELLLRWLPLTAAACFWWLAPTYLMGRYIFDFLPYTETAATTTSVTSLTNALRGLSQWTAHLPTGFSPWWPAGNTLATSSWLTAVTLLVAGLGLLGLRRSLHRPFLASSLLLGLAIIVTGHPGAFLADHFRELLDGPLASFRNLHKFDALIRLPLALGLALLPAGSRRALPRLRGARFLPRRWAESTRGVREALHRRGAARVAAAVLVALSVTPALSPGLGSPGAPRGVPRYLLDAADWLNGRLTERDGAVLALPGQPFGQYLYGQMMDDPLQSLLEDRWTGRMVTPGGSVGMARLMEAIDRRFATGQGSSGLATLLSRMGVEYVLIRNDVDRGVLDGAWPARLHDALAAMPELEKAAEFGEPVGMEYSDAIGSVDQEYPPVEIYRVSSAVPVATVAVGEPLRVGGGPEALIALADQGLLDDSRPVLFNEGEPDVATDTLRKREVAFSDLRGGSSPTLTADEPYSGSAVTKDFTEPGWEGYRTVAELSGIKAVTASSSSAQITAVSSPDSLSSHPFAALDGDPGTRWTSSGWRPPVGEWLKVEFTEARRPREITVSFARGRLLGPVVRQVAVETAAGRLVQPVRATAEPQRLRVPEGATSWLRLEITRTSAKDTLGNRVAIEELEIPGIEPRRSLAVPWSAASQVFTGLDGYSPACMRGSRSWVCSPYLGSDPEEGRAFERTFSSPGGAVRLAGTAILTDLERVSSLTGAETASSSSVMVEHPAVMARSAFDGDRSTVWISSLDAESPVLTRELDAPHTLSRLVFRFPAKRGPIRVTLTGDRGQVREGVIDKKGVLGFAPMRTRTLSVEFTGSQAVQVAELEIPEVPALDSSGTVPRRCGSGPVFRLGSTAVETRLVDASREDLLAGRPVRYESCAPVSLDSGRQTLSLHGSGFLVATAALLPGAAQTAGTAAAPAGGGAVLRRWEAAEREVSVRTDRASYLVVAENFNEGWKAFLGGKPLTAVKLDGWKQAWELPADASGPVRLVYEPDRVYRWSLAAGLLLVLGIAALALRPGTGPAPRESRPRGALLLWAVPVFGLWAAGWVGLLAGLVAVPLARRLPSASPPVLTALAACSTVAAGFLYLPGLPAVYPLLTEWIPACLLVAAAALLLTPSASADGPREAHGTFAP